MRTLVRQSLAYVVSAALLAAPLWGVPAAPLGVVTLAERAQISAVPTATGATVFDGDTLSTDTVGILRVRAGAAQFQLFTSSAAVVTRTSTGIRATLRRGTVAWSSANAGAIEMQASEARLRPLGNVPTQAQVTLLSPTELLVTARRGALEIIVGDETQTVPEATSYRVLLSPPDPQEPQGAGTKQAGKKPKPAGRNRFYVIPLIVVGMATAVAVHEAWESPEKP
ncbi:MAG TPA: hypothetical protein VK156_04065 [Candidatus Limnocylindria bacterium]|nr:hypothetical protein [Candidatus Limnocylindria bacterium]